MKILFIGVFNNQSTNISQAEAFEQQNCEVIRYDYRDRGRKIIRKDRDNEIIAICHENSPDFVLFSKCNGLHPRVIKKCRKISKSVLWYQDPMHNFDRPLRRKILKANFTFVALRKPYYAAFKLNPERVHFLHEGFDSLVDHPVDVEKRHDVVFIGSLYGHRLQYHEEVPFQVMRGIYREKHAKMVSASRINLNFTSGGTSDRTYKVLAAGGFLLTEPWLDMEKDFVPGKDLDVFNNAKELKSKIKYWLTHEEEREKIAKSGYEVVQKFSRDEWAKRIIEVVK
jgi:spore maturation protein CgeB